MCVSIKWIEIKNEHHIERKKSTQKINKSKQTSNILKFVGMSKRVVSAPMYNEHFIYYSNSNT